MASGKIVSWEELKQIRNTLLVQNKKIVFTNGCFDIIHRGHVEYLLKAKSLGDVLVIGLNSDESVCKIKGPKRPIIPFEDRAFIVSNLSPVDYVCSFEQETPLELIQYIVPDILVKGADWNINNVVGKDVVERAGGKVATIDFVPDRSTSSIIELILERFS
jgi:D-glycero-beta-D-manno-heptose 1-phosphate adenylyltransferase